MKVNQQWRRVRRTAASWHRDPVETQRPSGGDHVGVLTRSVAAGNIGRQGRPEDRRGQVGRQPKPVGAVGRAGEVERQAAVSIDAKTHYSIAILRGSR